MNLKKELTDLLNRVNRENVSDTPDYILSEYLLNCLEIFESAIKQREEWHGRG